jgi:hypothetical protein
VAVFDDLKAMSDEDVVYLARTLHSPSGTGGMPVVSGSTQVYRGRLRQAGNGAWVFNTFDGNNGVVGVALGQIDGSWSSAQTPTSGATVTIERVIYTYMDMNNPMPPGELRETIVLSEVIPSEFVQ